jgi:hypothetical protein
MGITFYSTPPPAAAFDVTADSPVLVAARALAERATPFVWDGVSHLLRAALDADGESWQPGRCAPRPLVKHGIPA